MINKQLRHYKSDTGHSTTKSAQLIKQKKTYEQEKQSFPDLPLTLKVKTIIEKKHRKHKKNNKQVQKRITCRNLPMTTEKIWQHIIQEICRKVNGVHHDR